MPNPRTPSPSHPALVLAAATQDFYGRYNNHWKGGSISDIWGVGPYVALQAGVTKNWGIEFIGALVSNFCEKKSATNLIDSIFRLGYQITLDQKDNWIPDFRVFLQEVFPTGHYQKLNPQKRGADLTGQGSFRTGFYLSSQKVFYLSCRHKLRIRATLGYFWPSTVSLQGFNYYGGNSQTKGKMHPGNYLVADLSQEFSLSRTWTIALEEHYYYGAKSHFSKKTGPNIARPSYAQFFLAPSIQKTFSSQFGALLGSSFSCAGKNTLEFFGMFIAFVYRF